MQLHEPVVDEAVKQRGLLSREGAPREAILDALVRVGLIEPQV